ncbi:hypothetical protein HOO68_04765 [Candidatus Gracilibacteria bacterium]|nr:hypothetical protein [Candidatus Gracilibacteria bacterium]
MKALSPKYLSHYYKYVSSHINQTMLVDELLKKYIIPYDDIQGIYNEETEEYTEVYQWLIFNNFDSQDYSKLIANNIPVIQSEYETWVGITSFGSHYDLYVYPQIINVLFDTDISYEDIENMQTS